MSSAVGSNALQGLLLGHQAALEGQLLHARTSILHGGTKGDVSEARWREMLTAHLPTRYRVCKGHVVDSVGACSEQIDVIIHDASYCPVFLEGGGSVFVPAESVYGVFEVKQELNVEYLNAASAKAASVRGLHRTSARIIDCGVEKPPRKLFGIMGGVLSTATVWQDGLAGLSGRLIELPALGQLDLGCALDAGAFELDANGEIAIYPREVALAAFFVRLVDRLQALGTVPAIDWKAYFAAAFPELSVPETA